MTKAGTDWIGNHSTRNIRINLFEAAILSRLRLALSIALPGGFK